MSGERQAGHGEWQAVRIRLVRGLTWTVSGLGVPGAVYSVPRLAGDVEKERNAPRLAAQPAQCRDARSMVAPMEERKCQGTSYELPSGRYIARSPGAHNVDTWACTVLAV